MNLLPPADGTKGQLVLLTPSGSSIPEVFAGGDPNPHLHDLLLGGVQKLRGQLYLQEGAIRADQLCSDGRHRLPTDSQSWHIVLLDPNGEVAGCARYLAHDYPVSFSRLGLAHSALAHSAEWGNELRAAIESDIEAAHRQNIAYVEVGGWALDPKLRCSADALRIALSAYSLARLLGGCIGIGTVTQRHYSSLILRRIGGRAPIYNGTELPAYFDPNYGCQMEILRFESRAPNPRFEVWVEGLSKYLATVPVVSDHTYIRSLQAALDIGSIPTQQPPRLDRTMVPATR